MRETQAASADHSGSSYAGCPARRCQETLVDPVEVVDALGSTVTVPERPEEARRIADGIDWPSWDVDARPIRCCTAQPYGLIALERSV